MSPFAAPTSRDSLIDTLAPLPVQGAAWPRWIKLTAWAIIVLIGVKLAHTATTLPPEAVTPVTAGSILLLYIALVYIARCMQTSVTRITHDGIEQTWITRRTVRWDEIQSAKFIPLIATKRLVCFTGRGRPVIFQAGTIPLQIAFAHIALAYGRRTG